MNYWHMNRRENIAQEHKHVINKENTHRKSSRGEILGFCFALAVLNGG